MLDDEFSAEEDLLERIESGQRGPLRVVYVTRAAEAETNGLDLSELCEWGSITGHFEIELVPTLDMAITHAETASVDILILLNAERPEAHQFAQRFPHLPIGIVQRGGFDHFEFSGWPKQVVSAGWSEPRPGEFADFLIAMAASRQNQPAYASPVTDIELVTNASRGMIDALASMPERRFELGHRAFEEIVAELLDKQGYRVTLTPRSGDKGRDVIAVFQTPAAPLLMLVECKRFAKHRLVGPDPVARVWSRLLDDKANMSMVITTSGFQPVARELAHSRGYQVSLKDGEDFIKWIRALRQEE